MQHVAILFIGFDGHGNAMLLMDTTLDSLEVDSEKLRLRI
jgi:hypothetical protein